MIAANVQLISNNHNLYERQVITCKPVHIGKNAWIGAGATILPGVTVGDNAVVGAASVVAKDVAPDTIVVGNPAKFIKAIPPIENSPLIHPTTNVSARVVFVLRQVIEECQLCEKTLKWRRKRNLDGSGVIAVIG